MAHAPEDEEAMDKLMREIEYTLGEGGFGTENELKDWHRHGNGLRITTKSGRIFVLTLRPM